MDTIKQSLIAKIAGKAIITPYEAIHLQYLNKLHLHEQELDVERWENLYIAADSIPELFSAYDLKNILSFQSQQDATLYDSYRWTAKYMMRLDENIGNTGYKAIALLNEMRMMRNEKVMQITCNLRDDALSEGTLLQFSAYSQVQGGVVTCEQIITSFTENFSLLLMSIDNILTLNYYLKTMVETADLDCLKFLHMVMAEEQTEEDDKDLPNIARTFFNRINDIIPADTVIETNHLKFVEFMKRKFSSFNITLDHAFQEGSLTYVKESLTKITNSTS